MVGLYDYGNATEQECIDDLQEVIEYILYEYNLTGKMLTFDGDYVVNAGRVRKNIENLVLYAKKPNERRNFLPIKPPSKA